MSDDTKDNFGRAARAVIVALGVFAWAWLIWNISADYTKRQTQAERYIQDYATATTEQIGRACTGLEAARLRECIAEQMEASRENERGERDLRAQQDMAEWAFWMFFVSAVTMGLTAVALWFVKGTLDATRRAVEDTSEATRAMHAANEIARENMELENRPILQFVGFELSEWGESRDKMLLRAQWQNIGKMPARPVGTRVFRAYVKGNPSEADIAGLVEEGPAQSDGESFVIVAVGGGHKSSPVMLESGELGVRKLAAEFVKMGEVDRYSDKCALIIAQVDYRAAIGGSTIWQTEQVMAIFPRYDGQMRLRTDDFGIGPPMILKMS